MTSLGVRRQAGVRLVPDQRRVITKPFLPGEGSDSTGRRQLEVVVDRILAMDESDVRATLREVRDGFDRRHRSFHGVLEANFDVVAERLRMADGLTHDRRLLIGAYFTHEYSIESAALGNPSMVAAPDQSGLDPGQTRFVMSLRAIGEGHISSIEFRSGVIDADATVAFDEAGLQAETGQRTTAIYDRAFFETKLNELGALGHLESVVLARLGARFTMSELEAALKALDDPVVDHVHAVEAAHLLHWLASSNYRVEFPARSELSERVIFPGGPTESRGMEDVRLVRFVQDDGDIVYFGTYTAFDGHQILPQLIETTDFVTFRIATLSGAVARNKGIALFPRMLDGEFVAMSRHDNMNNFVMRSTDVRVWHHAEMVQEPERPWELVQLGNCGSPLETEAGWLVITHGVGPLRQYSLGALLLDIDDPCRVIGHLAEPLLTPQADEREGYVPNVVYSCGAMIAGDHLVVPYGFADIGTGIATIGLDEILSRLIGP